MFNIQQFYVLPTQCIYVSCVDLRTNSDYFPIQHWLTGLYNWDGVCLLRGTDWVFIYNSTFCPYSVFMCFVWIWEQTAIISLYNINWLVCITETECVYCAVRTECYISFRWTSGRHVMRPSRHTLSRPLALQLYRAASMQPSMHPATRHNTNPTQFHSLIFTFFCWVVHETLLNRYLPHNVSDCRLEQPDFRIFPYYDFALKPSDTFSH